MIALKSNMHRAINWRAWSYSKWNNFLFDLNFLKEHNGGNYEVQTIKVSGLTHVLDASSDKEIWDVICQVVRQKFSENSGKSIHKVCSNLHEEHPNGIPAFFALKWVTCLIGHGYPFSSENKADFHKRLSGELRSTQGNIYTDPRHWLRIKSWLAQKQKYSNLDLPKKPEFMSNIGWSCLMALPNYRDKNKILSSLRGSGLLGLSNPPAEMLLKKLRQDHDSYTVMFRKYLNECLEKVRIANGDIDVLHTDGFFSAIQEMVSKEYEEGDRGEGEYSLGIRFFTEDDPELCIFDSKEEVVEKVDSRFEDETPQLLLSTKQATAYTRYVMSGVKTDLLLFKDGGGIDFPLCQPGESEYAVLALYRGDKMSELFKNVQCVQKFHEDWYIYDENQDHSGNQLTSNGFLKSLEKAGAIHSGLSVVTPKISIQGGVRVDGSYFFPSKRWRLMPKIYLSGSESSVTITDDSNHSRALISHRDGYWHFCESTCEEISSEENSQSRKYTIEAKTKVGDKEYTPTPRKIRFARNIVASPKDPRAGSFFLESGTANGEYAGVRRFDNESGEEVIPSLITTCEEQKQLFLPPKRLFLGPTFERRTSCLDSNRISGDRDDHVSICREYSVNNKYQAISPSEHSFEMADYISAFCVNRKTMGYQELQDVFRSETSGSREFYYYAALMRAWVESGSLIQLTGQTYGNIQYAPRRPHLILNHSIGGYDAIVSGLLTSQTLEKIKETVPGDINYKTSSNHLVPFLPMFKISCLKDINRLSEQLGLDAPRWIKYNRPMDYPSFLSDIISGDGNCERNPQPTEGELRGEWDWDESRFLKLGRSSNSKSVRLLWWKRKVGRDYYVIKKDGELIDWSLSKEWAVFFAHYIKNKIAFRLDSKGVIFSEGKDAVLLPLQFGRMCAILGDGVPGPTPIAENHFHDITYAYPFGRRLASVLKTYL